MIDKAGKIKIVQIVTEPFKIQSKIQCNFDFEHLFY